LGNLVPRSSPVLIEALRDAGEKINQIECGLSHVIAKSTLGKLYTWGWGKKGQLGHKNYKSCVFPDQIKWDSLKNGKIL